MVATTSIAQWQICRIQELSLLQSRQNSALSFKIVLILCGILAPLDMSQCRAATGLWESTDLSTSSPILLQPINVCKVVHKWSSHELIIRFAV